MVDERPKPKYGELAPEGWTWQPPAPPANDSDVPAPAAGQAAPGDGSGSGTGTGTPPPPYSAPPQPYAPPGQYGAPHGGGVNPGTGATKPLNIADVAITAFLLFVGVLLSASMVPTLFDFNRILNQAAAAQGYGTITPSAGADTAGAVVGVVSIILQLVAIVWSVRRLQRRKLASPIVIVIGIVTFALWVGVIAFAFFSDPAFLQQVMSTANTQ
ncbi:DUF6264 family protein [Subtercola sp. YIM 133946]|uniref:DUF6264 family protein n=1 Tax=Subtercola sp. YIM 133946 TaxID=3118909 RepID=UPI002F94EB52